jgi:hypothetical protein
MDHFLLEKESAMTMLDIQSQIDTAQSTGGGTVSLPAGIFECLPFEIRSLPATPYGAPVRLVGASPTYGRFAATVLRFTGAEVNATDRRACAIVSATGASIEGVAIEAAATTDKPSIGVLIRAHAGRCRDVSVHYMADYGFHVAASVADESNANNFSLEDCRAARCRIGCYVNGQETNAGRIVGCVADGNSQYGFFESSFLGNLYAGCHAANNAVANYAQGGSETDPAGGGVSNYSAFVDCYTEGDGPCPMVARQILVAGGNLAYTVSGPVQRVGYSSRLRFDDGDLDVAVPAVAGVRRAAFSYHYRGAPGADVDRHYAFERYASRSPAWLENTRCLDRLGTTWLTPIAWTDERHERGAGRLAQTMPSIGTPFRFALRKAALVTPGTPLPVQFDHSFLQETAGGYHGLLFLHAPSIMRAADLPAVVHDGWERIDANSVRTTLAVGGTTMVPCTVTLFGERTELVGGASG